MKLVIDERVKHRLVGIAVLLSIVVVFAPAVLKKSQQRFEDSLSISVKLPPKPPLPDVAVRQPKAIFQTMKVARVDIPKVAQPHVSESTFAKAEPLSPVDVNHASLPPLKKSDVVQRVAENVAPSQLVSAIDLARQREVLQQNNASKVTIPQATKAPVRPLASVVPVVPVGHAVPVVHAVPVAKPVPRSSLPSIAIKAKPQNKNAYGVQLATFANQSNAIALVAKLRQKGYQANYHQVNVKQGLVYYKVVVGNAAQRDQAQQLQKQLAQAIQLNGFVVAKEVS